MFAIDEELWANLYIFCYSVPNRTTSLAANYCARPTACSPEGQEPGLERVPGTCRLPATCSRRGALRGWDACWASVG